ncbi:MAG TPA: hypothetical protein ENL02_03430 [Epsilonproteobacteria bacterium]|nr:hypothetical protein [Campylobacterota bacterium]
MDKLKEYRYLILIIFAIFAILMAGALFSPSFTEQKTYLELFMLMGSLLFIFSVLVVVVILGFSSFALYMTFFIAAVIAMYGIEGALLVIGLTYVTWGFVFAIELLLVDQNVESATEWFQKRYTFTSFKREYYAFYPMMLILHLLIEILPSLMHRESISRFSPQQVFEKMRELLK